MTKEGKDNGKKDIQMLRNHYRGACIPRVISLFSELTLLRMKDIESGKDYI